MSYSCNVVTKFSLQKITSLRFSCNKTISCLIDPVTLCVASLSAEDISQREAAQKEAELKRCTFRLSLRCLPLTDIPKP